MTTCYTPYAPADFILQLMTTCYTPYVKADHIFQLMTTCYTPYAPAARSTRSPHEVQTPCTTNALTACGANQLQAVRTNCRYCAPTARGANPLHVVHAPLQTPGKLANYRELSRAAARCVGRRRRGTRSLQRF